jgi:RNA polymerase sigma factor for flagellar operon FliA
VARTDADVTRATVLPLHGTDHSIADVLPARTPGPAEVVERTEQVEYLVDAIEELPERLRAVVRGYFLEERPMAEIAAELGVTESRISQLRAEALVLLRGALAEALEPALADRSGDQTGIVARRRATYAASVAARHASRRGVAVAERSA